MGKGVVSKFVLVKQIIDINKFRIIIINMKK